MACCFCSRKPALHAPNELEQETIRVDRPLDPKKWKYTVGTDKEGRYYKHDFQVKDRENNIYNTSLTFRTKETLLHVYCVKALKHCYKTMSSEVARFYLRKDTPSASMHGIVTPEEKVVARGEHSGFAGNATYYGTSKVVKYDYDVPAVAYALLFPPNNRSNQNYHFIDNTGRIISFSNCNSAQAGASLPPYAFHSRIFICQEKRPNQFYHIHEPHMKRFKEEHGIHSTHTRARRAEEILKQLKAKEVNFDEVDALISQLRQHQDKTSFEYLMLFNKIGIKYYKMGLYAKAISNFERCAKDIRAFDYSKRPNKDETLATVLNNMAQAYEKLGNTEEANRCYTERCEVNGRIAAAKKTSPEAQSSSSAVQTSTAQAATSTSISDQIINLNLEFTYALPNQLSNEIRVYTSVNIKEGQVFINNVKRDVKELELSDDDRTKLIFSIFSVIQVVNERLSIVTTSMKADLHLNSSGVTEIDLNYTDSQGEKSKKFVADESFDSKDAVANITALICAAWKKQYFPEKEPLV